MLRYTITNTYTGKNTTKFILINDMIGQKMYFGTGSNQIVFIIQTLDHPIGGVFI